MDETADQKPEEAAPVRRRVLIIEDNQDIAESLADVLTECGHTVRSAGNGVRGWAVAQEFLPEVVLCDIGLPGGMDGYEVARKMRSEAALRGAFLIALTGYGQQADQRRATEAGFDLHLIKPVDLDALERILQQPGKGGVSGP